jgi:hypothetical protein
MRRHTSPGNIAVFFFSRGAGARTAFICGLLAALFLGMLPAAMAQFSSRKELQTFDYNPDSTDTVVPIQKERITIDYSDAEIVNDPAQGSYLVSKNRWKNWVARATYLLFVYLAFMVIILSLPKSEEYNLIIAYMLSGANAVLSFWVFLCAWLLFRLGSAAWMGILPLSLAMGAAAYMVLMRIKRMDISLTELKESFQRLRSLSSADKRLDSVEEGPGDWPDVDFVK